MVDANPVPKLIWGVWAIVAAMDRATLHQIIDELPEADLDQAATLVVAFRAHDRVALQSLLAEEAEPEPDELAATVEGDRDEPTVSLEDLERKYGAA